MWKNSRRIFTSSDSKVSPYNYVTDKYIECFHSRGQHLCKFIGTKESVCIRKEFNSQRIGLGHQHGHRDVMWKHSIHDSKSERHGCALKHCSVTPEELSGARRCS